MITLILLRNRNK